MGRVEQGRAVFDLGPVELGESFPWHFVLDPELRIRSVGVALAKSLPGLEGHRLDESFGLVGPQEKHLLDALLRFSGRTWLFQSRREPLVVLRGVVLEGTAGQLVFVGGPRMPVEVLSSFGLTLADFASPDTLVQSVWLRQAHQAAGSIRTENESIQGRLEELVRARTHELCKSNDELVRKTEELRAALEALTDAKAGRDREKAERERIEDELRLAHRLEAVGQLAAGVAHEINTPVQYIGDSVQFLRESYEDLVKLYPSYQRATERLRDAGDNEAADMMVALCEETDAEFLIAQVPKALDRAADGLRHVAGIVRAMKAFAHPGSESRSAADLNEALVNTLAVARNEYKYVADIETDLGELPHVPCYLAEMNQVFLNLVVNAAHAIGEAVEGTSKRGRILIKTAVEGTCATIEISDDGVGIPDALKERIFDPFFTTKPVGKGTGQGLTIARSIISKHQGKLEVRSRTGQGTTFKISLPLDEQAALCLN